MSDFKQKFITTVETVADKTRDLAEKAADKTRDFAERAADKTKGVTQIAKLTIEMNSEKDTIKKAYYDIGRMYFETYGEQPDELFAQLCDEIKLSNDSVSALEDEIARLKESLSSAGDPLNVDYEVVVSEDEDDAEAQSDADEGESEDSSGAPDIEVELETSEDEDEN